MTCSRRSPSIKPIHLFWLCPRVFSILYFIYFFVAEPACEHVEGGRYVGPEFQLGQVYDGGPTTCEADVVLYRPVYVCVSSLRSHLKTGNNFAANCAKLTQQNSKDRSTLLAATASKVIASNSPVTKAAVSAAANAASSASGQHSTASQDSWRVAVTPRMDFHRKLI